MIVPMAVAMPMVVTLGLGLNGFDPLAGNHGLAFEARGFDQAIKPPLKTQAIDDHQIGGCQSFGVSRCGVKRVGVSVDTNQGGDLHVRTTHLFNDISQNREACHDVQWFCLISAGLERQTKGGCQRQRKGGD